MLSLDVLPLETPTGGGLELAGALLALVEVVGFAVPFIFADAVFEELFGPGPRELDFEGMVADHLLYHNCLWII